VAQPIVVVTFYSRGGTTERLATAAAVGAVQHRAGIRMRRIPDANPAAVVERFPQHREELRRMHKEYVPPREADLLAADVLIVASPPDTPASAEEWASFLEGLSRLHEDGKLRGKVGAVVETGPASASFAAAMERLGLATVRAVTVDAGSDEMARAVALGRAAVAQVQARRA